MSIPYPSGLLMGRTDATKNWADALTASETLSYTKYKTIVVSESASLSEAWTKSATTRPSVTKNWTDGITAAETISLSMLPRAPQSFAAQHDFGWCPDIRYDVSWSNGGRSDTKTLERYDTGTGWVTISSTIGSAVESLADVVATTSTTKFRIKFNSVGDWTEVNVNPICPE